MGPEILIVGDRSHRGALIPRVQDLGYAVTPVRERELSGRVASTPAPAAVLVCLGDANAAELVDAVRRGRDDVPVVLLGSLGGELRDLADVLELGADHFLAAPVADEELARVLAELAGPGAPDDEGLPEEEEVADADSVRPLTGRATGGPVLGQLHRSLEALSARLQHHESSDSEPDALDLESLGLDATPDVDRELYPQGAEPLLTDPESSDPAAPRRPEPTQRIPARGRPTHETTEHEHSRGAMHGEQTARLRVDGPAARTTGRRASDLEAPARVPVRAGRRASDAVLPPVRKDRYDETASEAVRRDRYVDEAPGEPVRRDRSGDDAVLPDPTDRRAPSRASGRLDATDRIAAPPGERRHADRRWPAGPGETTARLLARRAEDPRTPDHADRTARVPPPDEPTRVRDEPGRFKIEAREPGRFKARPVDTHEGLDEAHDRPHASDTTARLATPRADVDAAKPPRPDADLTSAEPLAGIEVIDRLWQLHASGFDGRLTVSFRDGARRQLWWRSGEPVYAASTAPADGLISRLQARGLLARAQVPAAARLVDDDLLPSARRLVGAGLLKPREQQEAVRDAIARTFEALCSDDAERWHTDDEASPAAVAPDASVLALLTTGTRLGLGLERLREQLPGELILQLEIEDPAALARELGWPGAEAWLTLLDGTRSLAQLVDEDGLDEHDLWVAAAVLTAAGLAVPAEPDSDAALVEIDRRRIDERLALARASDYFALLGVRPDAGRAEVLRAHTDLRGTFADERLEPRTREELADALAELRAALDEARVVLLDEALRTAYTAGQPPEPGADPETT